MSALEKLHKIDRSLDTVFQSRRCNFLGVKMESSKRNEIKTLIKRFSDQKRELDVVYKAFTGKFNAGANMSPPLDHYGRSMMCSIAILKYNFRADVLPLLKKVDVDSQEFKIQFTAPSRVRSIFQILKAQTRDFGEYYSLSGLNGKYVSEKNAVVGKLTSIHSTLEELERSLLSVCLSEEPEPESDEDFGWP